MRPIYAILISIGLLASVYNYVTFAKRVRRPATVVEIDYAQGEFSAEVERSFDCEGDPIFGSESLKVLFKGETVFTQNDPIARDQPIVIQNLQGIESGENEIFVAANQKSPAAGLGAMKVTVKRNGVPIAQQVITSQPGLPTLGGRVVFSIDGFSDNTHQH